MEIFICLFILFAKIIETALATFRIIILNNNKKILASILSSMIAIIWIISTSLVVINIKTNFVRIIFLSIGCFIGSFIGSFIEEKLAFGYVMSLVITSDKYGEVITNNLLNNNILVTYTKGLSNNNLENILIIFYPRKKIIDVKSIINNTDKNAVISTLNVNFI